MLTCLYKYIVYHVGPNGWTKISSLDTNELYWQYYPPVGKPAFTMLDAPAGEEVEDEESA